jgi:transposase
MRLSQQLTANRMALKDLEPATPAGQALSRLLEVLQRELASLDRALKQVVKQLLPELCRLQGVGPCVAGVILAEVGDVRRFANEDHFAAYSGAAPVPKSSGKLKRVQVNPAGNRRLNWAFHMIALTRLRIDARSKALFERKQQEGKTPKEALRVLKTYIAREIYRFLKANPLTPPLSA